MERLHLTQEKIVIIIAGILFVIFSIALKGFLEINNIFSLVRNVSTLGILGVAMAIVVVGRGIDLSIVANMAMSVAWAFYLAGHGFSVTAALVMGLGFALSIGLLNGFLIAYAEIPAIFGTLATGIFAYGLVRFYLIDLDVIYLPPNGDAIAWVGTKYILGIPMPVILFALVASIAAFFLSYVKSGKQIYTIGDNLEAARICGMPVRPIIVLQYVLSALIANVAGIILATAVAGMNTRLANSTLIYDVILVVVIGGISLSGGRGGIRNVIVGTILIGILLNGMTIMDIQYTLQNIIKSAILLIAIIVDSLSNARDEQTAQQGDI